MKKIFQKSFMAVLLAGFVVTFIAAILIQSFSEMYRAEEQIRLKVEDTVNAIQEKQLLLEQIRNKNNGEALSKANLLAQIIGKDPELAESPHSLASLARILMVDEVVVINEKGVVTGSSEEEYIGYDMNSEEQSREFLPILKNRGLEVVQELRPRGYDNKEKRQYTGVSRMDAPGIVQVGYKAETVSNAMKTVDIGDLAAGFRVARTGSILVVQDGIIVSAKDQRLIGSTVKSLGITAGMLSKQGSFKAKVGGVKHLLLVEPVKSYYVVGMIPMQEVYQGRSIMIGALLLVDLVLLILVFLILFKLIDRVVIAGIHQINEALKKITAGALEERVDVRTCKEFDLLSDGINNTLLWLNETLEKLDSANALLVNQMEMQYDLGHIETILFDSHRNISRMFQALEVIGERESADRVYLREFVDGVCCGNLIEWRADGVESNEEQLSRQDLENKYPQFVNAFQSRFIIRVSDVEKIRESNPEAYGELKSRGIHSLVILPIWLADGNPAGYIGVENPQSPDNCAEYLTLAVPKFGAAYENLIAYRKIEEMGTMDYNTGVKSRNSYLKYVARFREAPPESLSVVFIDVNGLHEYNNTYGHEAGDQVLLFIATALKKWFDPQSVYRMGGDEFLVLLENPDPEQVEEAVRGAEKEIEEAGYHIAVGVETRDSDIDVEEMVKEADRKMYENKENYYGDRPAR